MPPVARVFLSEQESVDQLPPAGLWQENLAVPAVSSNATSRSEERRAVRPASSATTRAIGKPPGARERWADLTRLTRRQPGAAYRQVPHTPHGLESVPWP